MTFNQVVGGSNPPCLINKIPKLPRRIGIFVLSGYGGIGRRAGFRFQWATVQVQVLLSADLKSCLHSFANSFFHAYKMDVKEPDLYDPAHILYIYKYCLSYQQLRSLERYLQLFPELVLEELLLPRLQQRLRRQLPD